MEKAYQDMVTLILVRWHRAALGVNNLIQHGPAARFRAGDHKACIDYIVLINW